MTEFSKVKIYWLYVSFESITIANSYFITRDLAVEVFDTSPSLTGENGGSKSHCCNVL